MSDLIEEALKRADEIEAQIGCAVSECHLIRALVEQLEVKDKEIEKLNINMRIAKMNHETAIHNNKKYDELKEDNALLREQINSLEHTVKMYRQGRVMCAED